MMLTLQIAAGIVLAYVVIVNQRAILRASGLMLKLGVGLAILFAVLFAGAATFDAARDYLLVVSAFLAKAIAFVGVLVIMGLFFAGGYGLILCFRRAFRTAHPYLTGGDDLGIYLKPAAFTALNLAIVWLVTWPLLHFTVVGRWIDNIDRWSRGSIFADGAIMLITALAGLWSFGLAYLLRNREPIAAASKTPEAAGAEPSGRTNTKFPDGRRQWVFAGMWCLGLPATLIAAVLYRDPTADAGDLTAAFIGLVWVSYLIMMAGNVLLQGVLTFIRVLRAPVE